MEVRPGYEQTEVGVIPEDWGTTTLERAVVSGGLVRGPFGGALKKEVFVDRGYKVYEQRNAIHGTVEEGEYFIDSKKFRELERFRVEPGDFIVSCSGTIGCIYQIPGGAPDGVINQALLKITLDPARLDDRFFLAVFRSAAFQERIKENSHGGAMQNLVGIETFRKTQFQLPPTRAEQEAIAKALSDADAHIESLDQLLAKKRQLKQGAMQELLTGKKRLPSFSRAWAETTIRDLCPVEEGEVTYGGSANYLEIGDINVVNKAYDISGKEKLSVPGSVRVPQGTLLISRVRPTRGAIAITTEPAYVSHAFCRLRIANTFPFYIACQDRFLNYLGENSKGGTYPTCRTTDILEYAFLAPRAAEEQTAIAAMISDMDAELDALEEKVEKARHLKQGMMQELLTGRIRLL